jgi:hypothetical protein
MFSLLLAGYAAAACAVVADMPWRKTQRRCQTSEYEDSYALRITADSSLQRFAKFIHR